jgi:hypothetical protein
MYPLRCLRVPQVEYLCSSRPVQSNIASFCYLAGKGVASTINSRNIGDGKFTTK